MKNWYMVGQANGFLNNMEVTESKTKSWNFGVLIYPMDFKLLFLIQAIVAIGTHDLYTGRQDMVFTVGLPAVFYILGVYLSRIFYKEKPIGAYFTIAVMAVITSIKGVMELWSTYHSEYWRSGYYLQAFTGNIVEQNEVTFDFILLIAIVLAVLIAIKPSKAKTIIILALASLVGLYLFRHQLRDGRLHAIIEALGLTWVNPWGGFTVTSLGINTSHCMWLDYSRDYGIFVFTMLIIFEIMTVVEAMRFRKYLSENRLLAYTLLISFVLLTIFYALEGSPLTHKYIWYEGLVISGMMRGIRDVSEKNDAEVVSAFSGIRPVQFINGKLGADKFSSDKIKRIIFYLTCVSLFTYGFCFPIINEYVAGAFMAVLVIAEIIRQKYLPVDLPMLFLVEAMLCIALIDFHRDTQYMYKLQWAWVLPLGYLLGKAVVGAAKDCDKRCLSAYACLAAGMFLQGIVDYAYGFKQMAEWGYLSSAWAQFWTGEYEVRIAYEFELNLTISLIGVAIYIYKKNKALSIFLLFANIFIQLCAYLTNGRQTVIYMGLSLVIVAALNLYDKRLELGSFEKRLYTLLAIMIAAVAVVAIAFYKFHFWGLIEIDEESKWLRDGGIIHNIRFEADAEILQLLRDNPLGGFYGTILGGGQSHNMWTEYAREWGIVPFVLLVIFSCLTVVDALRLAFSRKVNLLVKYTLFSSFVCINLYYFMEPNAHAHRNFWLFGLFISGMIREINSRASGARLNSNS